MFGMGFTEILVIVVVAILFLGPDKLPSTMVEIAKFFRSIKQTVTSVKESINEEIHIEDIKKEAQSYKQELLEAQSKINQKLNPNLIKDEIESLVEDKPKPQTDQAIEVSYKDEDDEPTFVKKDSNEIDKTEEEKGKDV